MIVAALYDIHGNLPALEAVLREVGDSDANTILVGGDVAWGPWPRQTVERLGDLQLPTIFVRGNSDREVARAGAPSSSSESALAQVTAWCGDQLGDERRRWLDGLAPTVALDVEGLGRTLFCHGSPRSDEEIITVLTPEARLSKALGDAGEETIVCGHTHMQFDRTSDGRRVVNPGSVGMPYEGVPGAFWALIGPGVTMCRSAYDVEQTVAQMRTSGCPHVEEMFIASLTDPPDPAGVASHFESLAG